MMELFSDRLISGLYFPDWDTPYLSVFSPNARKYGPEKLRIRTLHAVPFTYFWTMFPVHTPWKYRKIFGFLVFSGGINWEHWPEMTKLFSKTLEAFVQGRGWFEGDFHIKSKNCPKCFLAFAWKWTQSFFLMKFQAYKLQIYLKTSLSQMSSC